MTPRKYGLVFVSAGLTITGVLWFSRPNPAIKGEDIAELTSAVVERQAIAYLTGTNAPSFSSNNVPVWITLEGLVNKVLTPSRNMATVEDSFLPAVYWLNDDISDGDALTGYNASWYVASTNADLGSGAYSSKVHTVTSYRLSAPSNNVKDYAWTTASRMPGNWTFLSNTTKTNAPLGRAIYGTNGWVDGTAKSWWGEIGNGTNVYAYWSERFVDSGIVTVNLLHGGGHVVTSGDIRFTTNNFSTPQTVSIKNTTTNSAGYFKIDVDNYGSTFVCVGSYPNTNPRVKKDGSGLGAYIATGGSIDFVMTSESAIRVPWTVNLTYSGDLTGPSSISSTEEPYYSADFTVICPASGGGTFDTYCPQTGAAQTVAVIGDTHNANIVVDAYAINVDNGGTADFAVSLATNPPPPYWTQSRAISTNYLNNAKNVLANLNRTIYICGPDELSFTSGVQVTSHSDGGWWYSNANVSVETLWELSASEAVARDPEPVVSWERYGRLIEYYRSAWSYSEKRSDGARWHSADYGMLLVSTRLNGCTLPYPSDYALASQYVANVSVYVATMNHAYNTLSGYYGMGMATTDCEITGSYSDFNGMLAAGFGIGVDPSTENLPTIPRTDATITDSAIYSTVDDTVPPLLSFRLLATSANPTERVKFTLGTLTPSVPNYAIRYDTHVTDTYPSYTVLYGIDQMQADITVDVALFIVVVDWKWKHMNLTTPYVPTVFTPEWLTANTNAP